MKNCELSIGSYPKFEYDARGGGGEAILISKGGIGKYSIVFDPNNFEIPSLNWRTTKFIGIPMLPGLEITISTQELKGYLDIITGDLSLVFTAHFNFSILSILKAPKLVVRTCLHNRDVKGSRKDINSFPLSDVFQTTVVGLAVIDQTGNKLLDKFLGLPNEALAVLHCQLTDLPSEIE